MMNMDLWAMIVIAVFMFATLLMAAVSNMTQAYYEQMLEEDFRYLLKHENEL